MTFNILFKKLFNAFVMWSTYAVLAKAVVLEERTVASGGLQTRITS